MGSAALIAIGLFCAFGGWYEEQTAEAIWGAVIIQAAGVAGYFIGRLVSAAKAPLVINWLNIVLCAFMPVSLTVMACMGRKFSPYPTDPISGGVFAAAYVVFAGMIFAVLKMSVWKRKKQRA